MREKLTERMKELGISDVGFCQVTDGPSGLNNAMSIVVKLSDAIIDEIETQPTHTYFNHYRTVNFFIDQCLLQAGLLLEKNGYKFITVAASQSINDEGWLYRGRYSHKAVARQAGLGSIGKSCLFLHKDYGPRVRLGTIFTDAPFENPVRLPPNPCTGCNICKEKCPSGAISGKMWVPGMEREEFFNRDKCSNHMKREYKHIGRGAVCGLCIKYCPLNKR
ncbi:MAG: epoxyqueuosine reductase [Oscillospiraceae bacterium]|nr:epoxyqueuosine reductase [Oscillospiraceae bacterium]